MINQRTPVAVGPSDRDAAGSEVVARNLNFSYARSVTEPEEADAATIEDLSFEIPKGQLAVIVGPSGCGKTTLLNLVGGLLRPTSGVLEVAGGDPVKQHKRMGYMPARDGLLPWRTAKRNVSIPLEGGRSPLTKRNCDARASELLRRLGLGVYEDYFPRELSQGMRQRVSLARALIADPELLLMDEPFGALDAQTKIHVQGAFLDTWEGTSRTVLFITHDLQEAILLADRLFVMSRDGGRIVADHQVDIPRPRAAVLHELFFSPEFRNIYHDLVHVVMDAGADDPGSRVAADKAPQ